MHNPSRSTPQHLMLLSTFLKKISPSSSVCEQHHFAIHLMVTSQTQVGLIKSIDLFFKPELIWHAPHWHTITSKAS